MNGARLWLVVVLTAAACKSVPDSRVGVAAIRFRGNDEISTADIEERIATQETPKFLGFFRASWRRYDDFAPEVLESDLERIRHFYKRRGYYDTEVRAGRVVSKGKYVDVEILIREGKPVLVRTLTLNGLEREPRRVLRRAKDGIALEEGAVFDEDKLEESTKGIEAVLANMGYAYAKVVPHAVVDLGPRTADLTFDAAPGVICKVGPVTLEGLDDLPESIIRRTFRIEAGDDYAADELDYGRRALTDLGVFASVDVMPDLSDPRRAEVPIKVVVTRSSLRGFRLGAGLQIDSTRADVHALMGWEHRNLWGGLRHFSIEERPALVFFPTSITNRKPPTRVFPANSLAATLSQPSFPEARTTSSLHAEFNSYPVLLPPIDENQKVFPGYHELRSSIGPERSFPEIKLRTALLYNFQANFPFTYRGDANPAFSRVFVSYIDWKGVFDLRDDPISTKQGFLLENSLQFAGGILGGDARDVRIRPALRMYFPLGAGVVLATRGLLGFVLGPNYGGTLDKGFTELANDAEFADYVRDRQLTYFRGFFSGGADSNRGYGYQDIGPHGVNPLLISSGFAAPTATADPAMRTPLQIVQQRCTRGDPMYDTTLCQDTASGGLSLWEASIEVRIHIVGPLGTVLFVDASDVSARTLDVRLDLPHLSTGFGIRYGTPVGPIRFDIGFRITDNDPNLAKLFNVPAAIAIGLGDAY